MSTEVILPKWGLTMEDGTLVTWLKQPGDRVEAGEILAEVETEKVTNELEAPVSGIVSQVLVAEGTEEIAVGTVLCIIEEDGHD
ncbi:MAG TPA: biotin attachment protein [Anaerolineae bacterium]|nr:biotin attachment protein [Anaerolineae bacterium]HMR66839.1 biotin attachment protein [Anaerolineae bacterium]